MSDVVDRRRYTAGTILGGDVRLLKVRQPWAQLLVEGQKDCENRTWQLTPRSGFPAWVLIVASKGISTRREYADAQSRLDATGQVNYRDALMSPTVGCILGAVKIDGCYAADSLRFKEHIFARHFCEAFPRLKVLQAPYWR